MLLAGRKSASVCSTLCFFSICSFRELFWINFMLQLWHLWGFSPVWVISWRRTSLGFRNFFPQVPHWWLSSPVCHLSCVRSECGELQVDSPVQYKNSVETRNLAWVTRGWVQARYATLEDVIDWVSGHMSPG